MFVITYFASPSKIYKQFYGYNYKPVLPDYYPHALGYYSA